MIDSASTIENHSAKLAELAAKRASLQQSLDEAEAYRDECVARREPFGKVENIETEMRRLRNALDDLGAEERKRVFRKSMRVTSRRRRAFARQSITLFKPGAGSSKLSPMGGKHSD